MLNRITINALFCLISLGTIAVGERWSRQISNAGFVNVGNDWVPLSFPVNRPGDERQTAGRVLNFSPLPHHQPPYIPHVFQQQQQQSQAEIRHPQQLNFAAGEPFQVVGQQRYLIQQSQNQGVQFAQQQTPPNPSAQPQLLFQQQSLQQSPSSTPMHNFPQPQPSIQPPQLIQHQLPPAEINHQYQIQHYPSQKSSAEHQHNLPQPPQQHRHQNAAPAKVQQFPQQQSQQFQHQQPQFHQQQQHQQHFSFPSTPTFLENELPAEMKPQQEQLIQRAPFLFHQEQEPEIRTNSPPQLPLESQHSQEEVQLLYVPIDTLYQQKPNQHQQQLHANNKYSVIPPPVNPLQINNFYTPDPSINQYPSTTPAPRFSSPNPTPTFERSTTYRFAQQPSYPTPKPKVKSHQPPLAMFMLNDVGDNDISVNDVLSALKNAKNIDVLDSASKKSPKVFVGPSGLRTPTGYTKFELPYLSSIEQNRSERQVTKLPFFVAPLSYKAPNGFAKIPLPAPHVGSVVVNMPAAEKSQFIQPALPSSQRTQFYPKKVQPSPSSTDYSVEKPLVYKSSSKPNLGFKFGSDVFTTTQRPYLEQQYPSSTQQSPVTNERYQPYVVSSTQAPKKYEPFSRFQDLKSTPSYQPYTFESTTTPKKYEPNFDRFQDQVSYRDSKPTISSTSFQSPPTNTHGQENFNSFENTSPQRLSASTPQTPLTEDYKQQNHFQTFNRNSKPTSVSSTAFPSSTATSFEQDQFEDVTNTPLKNQDYHSRNPYHTDVSAFRNFKPIPNGHVLNEEYFNVQKGSDMKSFSTHVETPLNTTQIQENYIANTLNQFQPTQNYFSVPNVGQDVSNSAPKQTISENAYNDAHSRLKQVSPRPEITFTSKPTEYSTRAQEIHKMKSYFREQDAFKNRQKIPISSSSEASSEASSSTPQSYNFEISTEQSIEGSEKASSPRSTVTYYTPASSFDLDSTPPVVQYKLVQSVVNKNYGYKGPEDDRADITTQTYEPKEYRFTSSEKPREKNQFSNEAAVYDSSSHSPYVDYVKVTANKKKYKLPVDSVETDEIVTDKYTKSLYTLPSELPPISASLPGMVNSLFEDEDREAGTTLIPPTSTTVVTRRTPTRGRRPQTATRATVTRAPVTRPQTTPRSSITASSNKDDDGTSSVTTTRRPISRGRRPIHYANRTTTVRTPTARNPNRVRFNPTPEERQRFRSRQQKGGKKDEENLEYQRDVLNQNYPVIQRSVVPTTAAPVTITEKQQTTAMSYAHETEKYIVDAEDAYVVPPNHSASPRDYLLTTPKVINPFDIADHFAGLQDHHMQLPQEHDTGSQASYFNSEADIAAADILNSQNVLESRPVYQSSSEIIQENIIDQQRPKRPNFAKRPNNGRTLTTTPATQTVSVSALQHEKSPKERYTLRPKARIDSTTVQYTPKARSVRIRTRPPATTIPTTTSAPEVETYVDESYHQINRFNKDFYQESVLQNHQPQGVRATVSPLNDQKKYKFDKSRFALDTQESQWSTKVGQNSFHPVDHSDGKSSKSLKESYEYIEPEIVTAGTIGIESNQDTYLLNVASNKNYVSFNINDDQDTASKLRRDDLDRTTVSAEPSFVDLLEQAMSDLGNEIVTKHAGLQDRTEIIATTTPSATESTDQTTTEQGKTGSGNNNKRRGVWKRVRVRPVDGFETAESQNIGNQIYNTILSNNSKELAEQNRDAHKGFKTSYQSYKLEGQSDEDVEELVAQNNDTVIVTKKPEDDTTTMYSPGDIDLGTGAPVLVDVSANRSVEITERNEVTTDMPDIMTTTIEQEEPVTVEDELTTVETRRHDTHEPEETTDAASSDEEEVARTDSPYMNTERTYYDDYDAEFKTESSDLENLASVTTIRDSEVAPSVITTSDSSNIIDEVKQKLTELFSFSDDYDYHENSLKPKVYPQIYTTIERTRPTKLNSDNDENSEHDQDNEDNATDLSTSPSSTEATRSAAAVTPLSSFHRNLMDSVIYATSTSTEVSHETEICYRGRCIKTDRKN